MDAIERTKYRIIIISILAAVSFWILDAVMDSLVFSDEPFLELLVSNKNEVAFRLLFSTCFIGFGVFMARSFARQKQVEEDLQRDIAERRDTEEALRESEQKYRALFDSASDAILIIDAEGENRGRIIAANRAAAEMHGYTVEELTGMHITDIDTPESAQKASDRITDMLNGKRLVFEVEHRHQNGSVFPLEVTAGLLTIKGHRYIQAFDRDITGRRQAEDRIRESLKEKETLLREIHHRVKNNLNIVQSLLRLKSRHVTDPNLINMFQECENRIKSMALVHEKLYRTRDLSRIDCDEYIPSLLSSLSSSYIGRRARIELKTEIEKISFDIDNMVPCGLIINELVTNSLKYAFPEDRGGEIVVGLRAEGNKYMLFVKDDGVGLPEGFDLEGATSLGLRLVSLLTDQLDGNLEILSGAGSEFRIIF